MSHHLPLRIRFKEFRREFYRKPFILKLAAFILATYIRIIYHTSRKQVVMPDTAKPYMLTGEKNAIFTLWHGRLMLVAPFRPTQRLMHVLVSHHSDGEIIALTMEALRVGTVRGSSSQGGSRAVRNMLRHFRSGTNIGITPDGPRGPNRVAQAGVIHVARMAGCPIIPLAIASSWRKQLGSWDNMQIPFPFGRLTLVVGEPQFVERENGADDASIERTRLEVENALNRITAEADRLVGHAA